LNSHFERNKQTSTNNGTGTGTRTSGRDWILR